MFNFKIINVFKTKYKIGPIAGTDWEANSTNSEVIVNNAVFAIDIDGVISDDLETGSESYTQVVTSDDIPPIHGSSRQTRTTKFCVNIYIGLLKLNMATTKNRPPP